ncbi:hypothetical protein KO507_11420 [Gilvimarinus agarilyticus]|uniref:hypothetical protein n=1 Tax=Gilvimarinus sp. 2_MG-2023 TaxID=3062666 RepID=UPI001C099A84|nr:hypothetical protein [Gilvimarinus sp. 2_MG-2023]MBU2886374.1 hypothetical protein [Gilvimarinus agarilyticus]MDO6571053.1 hypothetical protein [Gilvimarinus sp. 2_MG-2023]
MIFLRFSVARKNISVMTIMLLLTACGSGSSDNSSEKSSSDQAGNSSTSSSSLISSSSSVASSSLSSQVSSSDKSSSSSTHSSSSSSDASSASSDDGGSDNDQSVYFEDHVFDEEPDIIFAVENLNQETDDTQRVLSALKTAGNEENGGVVVLRPAEDGQNKRYRLDRIDMPSNTRLEIDPNVTIEMIGALKTNGPTQFLFNIGRSQRINQLMPERVKNVQITSTQPGERFTIDARTNMPISYGPHGDKTKDTSRNFTRAIPVGIYYAENFSISDVLILDNHTESVGVQMYPDTDYQDGALADRKGTNGNPSDDVFLNEAGEALATNDQGHFVDESGAVLSDSDAIIRNNTYGRTPRKGTIDNIRIEGAHTGYGAVQTYGADWIYISNIEAVNGVGVRLESGNGAPNDNINRAGPYLSSINNIEVHNVTVWNAFTGVWLKAHSKINTNILVDTVTAIDSGTAILSDKSRMHEAARDFINGRFENTKIIGDITLERTTDNPVAEVGNALTYFMSPAERDALADVTGDDRITQADLPHNDSGRRWYLMQPTSPMVIATQRNATEIGNTSSDVTVDEAGYYAIDFSEAVTKSINPLRNEDILFNEDARNLNGGPSNRL